MSRTKRINDFLDESRIDFFAVSLLLDELEKGTCQLLVLALYVAEVDSFPLDKRELEGVVKSRNRKQGGTRRMSFISHDLKAPVKQPRTMSLVLTV